METDTRPQCIKSLAQTYAQKRCLDPASKSIIKYLHRMAEVGIVVTEFQVSTAHQESLIKGFATSVVVSSLRHAVEFSDLYGSFHALENSEPEPAQAPHPFNDYFILPRRNELDLLDPLPAQLETELESARSFSIWDPFMRKSHLWKILDKAVK